MEREREEIWRIRERGEGQFNTHTHTHAHTQGGTFSGGGARFAAPQLVERELKVTYKCVWGSVGLHTETIRPGNSECSEVLVERTGGWFSQTLAALTAEILSLHDLHSRLPSTASHNSFSHTFIYWGSHTSANSVSVCVCVCVRVCVSLVGSSMQV